MSNYSPTVGEDLAGYRIEALAGRGGMGEVYRAYDARLGRSVALKLLVPRLAEDERFRERFLRESRRAAGIDHPNVIPVYEAGEAEGRLYIAMRYVEGTDLRRLLSSEGMLEPARALGLLAPVAGALDAAHARGLVHRDVKPGNVLIAVEPDSEPPEHVYLSDFGLTTLSAEPDDSGPFSGTADYAAPELVTGGSVDGRADGYALGCVLFECLTGTPPFRGDSAMAVLWGHVNDPVPAASSRNPSLPAGIDGVLRKALAKEPAERYPTCRALVEAARDTLGVTGIDVPTLARRRWLGAVALLAAALAATGTLLGIFLSRGGGSAAPAAGGALVRIDPASNRAGKPIAVGAGPTNVAANDHDVWVSAPRDASLWRFTPTSGVLSKVGAVGIPGDVALHGDKAFVAAEGPQLASGNVTIYEASSGQRIGGVQILACSLTAGAYGAWVAGCPNVQRLSTQDPVKVLRTVAIPYASPRDTAHSRGELVDMTSGMGSVWVMGDVSDPRLWRIDPRTGTITRTYELDVWPQHVEFGAGSIWLVDQLGDVVVRIDPESGHVLARIRIGRIASGLTFGGGSIWAASVLDRTVSRIDPRSNRVVATISVHERPRDLAFGAGAIWVVGDAT